MLSSCLAFATGRSSIRRCRWRAGGVTRSNRWHHLGGSPDRTRRTAYVLLDAAERVLIAEGYAAVSSRRVAAEAGLKPQLVHYYFATMDELFLAVFRRRGDEGLVRQAAALASDEPVRALWEFSIDDAGTALTVEFVSLGATARPSDRRSQDRRAAARDADRGVDDRPRRRRRRPRRVLPGSGLGHADERVPRDQSWSSTLGLTTGHAEAIAVAERLIAKLDTAAMPPANRKCELSGSKST